MPRLLMVATVPTTLRAFLLPFVRHFQSQGWIVDGMSKDISKLRECVECFDNVWDIEWARHPLDPQNLRAGLRTLQNIRSLVEREHYSIVHVHTPVASFITRYALRNLRRQIGTSVIYTAHGFHFHPLGSPWKNWIFLGLEKLAGRWTDYLIVINKEDQAAALKHGIVPSDHIRYTPGIGIDTSTYSPDKVSTEDVSSIRKELNIPDHTPLFLLIAEYIPRKRHKMALQAFAIVCKTHSAHLALAGDGPLFDQMKSMADQLGISGKVHFLGRRSDIPVLLKASLATVMTSLHEGVPRSLLESLSMKTPAIGVDIRGVRELLEDGRGIIVPPSDIKALAEAMVWMIEHPIEAEQMGEKGREKMQGPYELANIIQTYERIYSEAISQAQMPQVSRTPYSWRGAP